LQLQQEQQRCRQHCCYQVLLSLLLLVLPRPRQMKVLLSPLLLLLLYLQLPVVQLLLEVLLPRGPVQQQAGLLPHLRSLQERLQALLLLPAVAQPSAAAAAQAALGLVLLLAALAGTAA
jgi:hypothetical protein